MQVVRAMRVTILEMMACAAAEKKRVVVVLASLGLALVGVIDYRALSPSALQS